MGAELIEIEMYPREEMQDYINTRRDTLLAALNGSDAPEKEPSFLCDYCAFKEVCQP